MAGDMALSTRCSTPHKEDLAMMTNREISERHPELAELREFKTNEEIVEAVKGGRTIWHVMTVNRRPRVG